MGWGLIMAAVALLFKPFFQTLSLYISGRMLFPARLTSRDHTHATGRAAVLAGLGRGEAVRQRNIRS